MNTSSATVVTLPVPRSPATSQSSSTVSSLIGTTAMIGSAPPSAVGRMAESSFHWLCAAPLLKAQLPETTIPPSLGVAMPVGASVPQIRTSGSAKISSWTSSGKCATLPVMIHQAATLNAADPSPRPSSMPTSTMVLGSDS